MSGSRFLILVIISFVFLCVFSFNLGDLSVTNKQVQSEVKAETSLNEQNIYPFIINEQDFDSASISAKSVYVLDLNSNRALLSINPDIKSLPASTAKIITFLVATEYYPVDRILKVKNIFVEGQKMNLVENEEINVRSLLYGLLVYSANDAAEVLAQNYPGGREMFISRMNLKIKEIGLNESNILSPTGLDYEGQYTTARDLLKAAKYALDKPMFLEIVSTKNLTVESVNGVYKHPLVNLNKLLWEVDGVRGVKTGWTENALENLVTYYEKGNVKFLVALLGSGDRFSDTKTVINFVLNKYYWENL